MRMIAALVLLSSGGIQAQTTQSGLDQVRLMKQFTGTWQQTGKTDTLFMFEMQQYENAFQQTNYHIVNGRKFIDVLYSYSFSPKEGKFRNVGHRPDGQYLFWFAAFTAENKLCLDQVQNFDSNKVIRKHEAKLKDADSFQKTATNAEGKIIEVTQWARAKQNQDMK